MIVKTSGATVLKLMQKTTVTHAVSVVEVFFNDAASIYIAGYFAFCVCVAFLFLLLLPNFLSFSIPEVTAALHRHHFNTTPVLPLSQINEAPRPPGQ